MFKNVGLIFLVLFSLFPVQAIALSPDEVLVIANRFVPESVDLARYYMDKRGIPKENLIKITTTEKETCSREIYNNEIAEPVRNFLLNRKGIQALVTVYGVPLKVKQPKLTGEEKKQLKLQREQSKQLNAQLKAIEGKKSPEEKGLKEKLSSVYKQIRVQTKWDHSAAVDSELALVLNDTYNLKFWQSNPYFVGFQKQSLPFGKDSVVMVSRLDGPSIEIVKRIIVDSLYAEKNGLTGTAYFDAKGKRSKKKQLKPGYAFYDHSLHLAADRVTARKLMPVVVNEKRELFKTGDAPDAALYCGWYSLARYVDAFDWKRGSVGYHIASSECATLRPGTSNVWCKRMLEDGAAAVIGPVGEPYVQAFPIPEMFFSFLTDGYYTLAEAYFLSLPYLSWQMILVGDPLYRPFNKMK